MDALFVFQHSKADDLEIRYALRGIARHLPWVRKVWVFGDRPVFLSNDTSRIEHVPHSRVAKLDGSPTPIRNFFKMLFLSSLIGDLSSEYLWFCDDFILIDDCSPDEMRRVRYLDDLANAKSRGKGLWKESLWRTYDVLKRLGYPGLNFETHSPTYFRKDGIFDAYCDFQDFITNDRWFGMLGPTAILNHVLKNQQFPITKLADEGWKVGWYGKPPVMKDIVEGVRGKRFLNFDDGAFGEDMRRFLAEKFLGPCIYEQGGTPMVAFEKTPATRQASVPVTIQRTLHGTFVVSTLLPVSMSQKVPTLDEAMSLLAAELNKKMSGKQ